MMSFMAPSSASTQLYFAHLTDGGGWTTSLFFSNPNQSVAATVNVRFYSDNGQPLQLDFGSGPAATLSLTVAANGVQMISSQGAGTEALGGWAYASADVPLVGTLMYRFMSNGKPLWDVAAAATGPTYYYYSYATSRIGVAIDNPSATQTIQVIVNAQDSTGKSSGYYALTLPPLAHSAFNLNEAINTLPDSFSGSITITPAGTQIAPFLAYTIGVRDGLLAPLPPGELRSPAPADRLLADAAALVRISVPSWVQIAADFGDFSDQMVAAAFQRLATNLTLNVTSSPSLTADYQLTASGVRVNVSRLMLEALSDSKSALTFLVAHYVIRAAIEASRNPSLEFATDPAGASNFYALITVLIANLGPNGMIDFHGRMQMAMLLGLTVDPAVKTEFLVTGDYTGRISRAWRDLIETGCSGAGQQACAILHDLWHPSYPPLIP
jgi:hypothetical protein